jgi:hypothetical protein
MRVLLCFVIWDSGLRGSMGTGGPAAVSWRKMLWKWTLLTGRRVRDIMSMTPHCRPNSYRAPVGQSPSHLACPATDARAPPEPAVPEAPIRSAGYSLCCAVPWLVRNASHGSLSPGTRCAPRPTCRARAPVRTRAVPHDRRCVPPSLSRRRRTFGRSGREHPNVRRVLGAMISRGTSYNVKATAGRPGRCRRRPYIFV